MDNNSWRAAQGQISQGQGRAGEASAMPNATNAVAATAIDNGDWRTLLQADSRQRMVNKIMDILKRHLPFSGQEGLQELKKTAVRLEEKTYTVATSQSDYSRKISLKMITLKAKSQNPMANSNAKNPSGPEANIVHTLACAKEKKNSPTTRRSSRSKVEETPFSGSGMKRKASTRLKAQKKKGSSSPIRGSQLLLENEVESPVVEASIPQDPMPIEVPKEVAHHPGKEPVGATPQVEEYFRPKWHIKESDCIDNATKAVELLSHLTPRGERERMRSLGLANVESMYFFAQSQVLLFGQELLRKGRSDRDRVATLESILNMKNKVIQEGEFSKKKLYDENETLKNDLSKVKEELTSMKEKLEVCEQEKTKKLEECTNVLKEHQSFVEEMNARVLEKERKIQELKDALDARNAIFGSGLLENEMIEAAKRAGCEHFLKTKDGKGLIMRLVDGSVRTTLVEADKAIKKVHPEFIFPSTLQTLLDDESALPLMPWEEGFNFDQYAKPFSSPEASESEGESSSENRKDGS